jgi:hypothetical protein
MLGRAKGSVINATSVAIKNFFHLKQDRDQISGSCLKPHSFFSSIVSFSLRNNGDFERL